MPINTFSTILVATDFSEGSDEALASAIDAARLLGARIEILHVVDSALDLFTPFSPYFELDPQSGASIYVVRSLEERAARVRAAGVRCETCVRNGNTDIEIVRRGAELDANLVVVGTHGRSGLAHVVMGSVAERVVQHARRPVLTIPYSGSAA